MFVARRRLTAWIVGILAGAITIAGCAGQETGSRLTTTTVTAVTTTATSLLTPSTRSAADLNQDRLAESDLRTALAAEKSLYANSQTFIDTLSAANRSQLAQLAPALTWVLPAKMYTVHNVSATTESPATLVVATESASKTCLYIADIEPAGTGPNSPVTRSAPGIYYISGRDKGPCPNARVPGGTPTLAKSAGSYTWALAF